MPIRLDVALLRHIIALLPLGGDEDHRTVRPHQPDHPRFALTCGARCGPKSNDPLPVPVYPTGKQRWAHGCGLRCRAPGCESVPEKIWNLEELHATRKIDP